jgi:hypothetical protein
MGLRMGVYERLSTEKFAISAPMKMGPAQGVATVKYLWTPGQDVTYVFLQGTGQATSYRRK